MTDTARYQAETPYFHTKTTLRIRPTEGHGQGTELRLTLCWTDDSPAKCQYQAHRDCLAIYRGLMGLEETQLYLNIGDSYKAYLPNGTVRKCQVEYDGARLDIDPTENDVRISLRAFYVDELTVGASAEALPDKDVDIVLTHEEAQRIADQLFPWL